MAVLIFSGSPSFWSAVAGGPDVTEIDFRRRWQSKSAARLTIYTAGDPNATFDDPISICRRTTNRKRYGERPILYSAYTVIMNPEVNGLFRLLKNVRFQLMTVLALM